MSERPILFSGPMVRALLDGRKTQTRRAIRNQPHDGARILVERYSPTVVDRHGEEQPGKEIYGAYSDDDGEWGCKCPYGQPLDRLWVRETGWERPERTPRMMREGADTWEKYYYDADGEAGDDMKEWGFKRRPSIFMPRWASRITLEITGVRVERLRDISRMDCVAEGWPMDERQAEQVGLVRDAHFSDDHIDDAALEWYADLFESINGKGAWDANPWVWCIEFKRIAP